MPRKNDDVHLAINAFRSESDCSVFEWARKCVAYPLTILSGFLLRARTSGLRFRARTNGLGLRFCGSCLLRPARGLLADIDFLELFRAVANVGVLAFGVELYGTDQSLLDRGFRIDAARHGSPATDKRYDRSLVCRLNLDSRTPKELFVDGLEGHIDMSAFDDHLFDTKLTVLVERTGLWRFIRKTDSSQQERNDRNSKQHWKPQASRERLSYRVDVRYQLRPPRQVILIAMLRKA